MLSSFSLNEQAFPNSSAGVEDINVISEIVTTQIFDSKSESSSGYLYLC